MRQHVVGQPTHRQSRWTILLPMMIFTAHSLCMAMSEAGARKCIYQEMAMPIPVGVLSLAFCNLLVR